MSEPLRVAITGATSGLGREMAVQLGRRGFRVAVTGRRRDKLEETARAVRAAGGACLPLEGPVGELAAVRRHYAEIRAAWGGLDWAILNAGVGDSKDAREFSAQDYRWTFETNVFGVANWLEAVLPDMLAAGRGTVAAVASLAGFRGLPGSGSYCASKAAVIAMMESARLDLRGTGVRAVAVCPGFVKSELTDRNEPGKMPFLMDTADGARAILDGVEAGRPIVHFPWPLSRFVKDVARNLPPALYDPLMLRFGKRRKAPYRGVTPS
ncbi:MAG TPA: SDR family NAD(P)-dependent oxidoreductase [Elusimicrobiota bacterium]|nr:SDR family NAD(P)-dependent oxidoreductase [Elusimicrobiota bacterium]